MKDQQLFSIFATFTSDPITRC